MGVIVLPTGCVFKVKRDNWHNDRIVRDGKAAPQVSDLDIAMNHLWPVAIAPVIQIKIDEPDGVIDSRAFCARVDESKGTDLSFIYVLL
jgi:hypothetical protein